MNDERLGMWLRQTPLIWTKTIKAPKIPIPWNVQWKLNAFWKTIYSAKTSLSQDFDVSNYKKATSINVLQIAIEVEMIDDFSSTATFVLLIKK